MRIRRQRNLLVILLVIALMSASTLWLTGLWLTGANRASTDDHPDIFTPAHPTAAAAVRDFLNWRRTPVQPIAHTHKVHLAKGLQCDSCHTAAAEGPQAGISGVKFCMSCHQVIATEKPEIKKMAAYLERGEEIPWERVYDYSSSANVRFNHAPHIRSEVLCSACHGDMTGQTTAQRVVNMDMGYCITCHQQDNASVDCTTCHF